MPTVGKNPLQLTAFHVVLLSCLVVGATCTLADETMAVRGDFFRIKPEARSVNPILKTRSFPKDRCLLTCLGKDSCLGINLRRTIADEESSVECELFTADSEESGVVFISTSQSWISAVRSGTYSMHSYNNQSTTLGTINQFESAKSSSNIYPVVDFVTVSILLVTSTSARLICNKIYSPIYYFPNYIVVMNLMISTTVLQYHSCHYLNLFLHICCFSN